MELSGQLTEIIYQNEVNSYLIGILENEEDTITIVGYMPFLVEGDYIKVIGNFVTHKGLILLLFFQIKWRKLA